MRGHAFKACFFLTLALIVPMISGCFSDNTTLCNTSSTGLANVEEISIDYGIDNLTILASPTDKLVVQEYFSSNDSSYYATVQKNDSVVTVQTGTRPSKKDFTSHVDLLIPTSFEGVLRITTSSGMISMGTPSRLDSCIFKTTSGTIKAAGVTAEHISLSTLSGRISADRCAGRIEAKSTSGSIDLINVTGSAILSNGTGRTQASFNSVKGDISSISTSGKIEVFVPKALGYSLTVKTLEGRVRTPISNEELTLIEKQETRYDTSENPVNVVAKTYEGTAGVYQRCHIMLESTTGAIELGLR